MKESLSKYAVILFHPLRQCTFSGICRRQVFIDNTATRERISDVLEKGIKP